MTVQNQKLLYNTIEMILEAVLNRDKVDKNVFLQDIFCTLIDLIPEAEKGTFFEVKDNMLFPVTTKGYDLEKVKSLELKTDMACSNYNVVLRNEIDAYISFIDNRNELAYTQEQIKIFKEIGTGDAFYCLFAPIKFNDINQAIICLDNFDDGFSSESKDLLSFFARLISTNYATLFELKREAKLYKDVVKALVSAIEIKDNYTQGHGRRVADYCKILANKLELNIKQKDDLFVAALLHDIGKIGICDSILNKPGRLTENEFESIKQHPEYSKNIVGNINAFKDVAEIIYSHHERIDGFGYPRRLEAKDIPFESQIIMVCDAYDAITSDRVYKEARTKEEAMVILKEQSNKQFNATIVDAFCELLECEL